MPSSSSNCDISVANNQRAQTKSVIFYKNSSKTQVEKVFKKMGRESWGDFDCKVIILKCQLKFPSCKSGTANVLVTAVGTLSANANTTVSFL